MNVDGFAYGAAAVCALTCAIAALQVSRGRARVFGALLLMAIGWAQLCGYYPDPLDPTGNKGNPSEVLAGLGGCLGILVGRLLAWEARPGERAGSFVVTGWEWCAAIFVGQMAVPHTLLVYVLDLVGIHVRSGFTRELFITASIQIGFVSLWRGVFLMARPIAQRVVGPTVVLYMIFELIYAIWISIPAAWTGIDHSMPDWLKISFGVMKLILTFELCFVLNRHTSPAHGRTVTRAPVTAAAEVVAAS